MTIELNKQLMAFIDVVNYGSFAEAAKHRDMLPSQMSRNIKTLEEKLGLVLLKRTTRALALSEAGEEIYRQAQQIKQMEEKLNRYAKGYSGTTSGLVRVTCAAHLSRKYVLPTIASVQAQYPDIRFEVNYDDRQVDMVKENFDLAIRVWKPKDSTLIGQKLQDTKLVLLASPAFIERYGQPQSLEDLAALPSACYCRSGFIRDKIRYYDDEDRIQTVNMNPSYKSSSSDSLIHSAKAGMYYTMVTYHNLNDELETGELIRLFPDTRFPEEGSIYAIYPNRDLSFGSRLFVEELKARFSQG